METGFNEMDDNELIEHEIKVDKFLSVKMKIPKKMDALELKALATKSQKLLNLSDLSVQRHPRQTRVRISIDEKKEFVNEISEAKKKGQLEEMAKKYGCTVSELRKKGYDFAYAVKKNESITR